MQIEDRLRRDEQCRPPLPLDEVGKRATSARADQVERARLTWRQRTATWWRTGRISASVANASLLANLSAPKARWTSRYKNESTTASSLADFILAGQDSGWAFLDPSGERGVAVADEELDRARRLGELHREVPGLLGHPVGDRV